VDAGGRHKKEGVQEEREGKEKDLKVNIVELFNRVSFRETWVVRNKLTSPK